jgi:hypothetical protein
MFKLTVEQILSSIATLTQEEKNELQNRLSNVLSTKASDLSQEGRSQSQSFGNISISGNGNDFAAIQSGNDLDLIKSNSFPSSQNIDFQEALSLLENLRQELSLTPSLNTIEKRVLEIPIKTAEEELKKSKPDKDLIDQSIKSLKKGLEGIQSLAEPVMKVAALVAKAWIIL